MWTRRSTELWNLRVPPHLPWRLYICILPWIHFVMFCYIYVFSSCCGTSRSISSSCHDSTANIVCSSRSPWSNKYEPPLDDGALPSDRLRKLEIEANTAFDQYREMSVKPLVPSMALFGDWLYVTTRYFETGVSSVYLWDLEHGFAGVVLIKKGGMLFGLLELYGWLLTVCDYWLIQLVMGLRKSRDVGILFMLLKYRRRVAVDRRITNSHRLQCCGYRCAVVVTVTEMILCSHWCQLMID